ncbi:MAG TPA: zinc ribbon domain-containing protein [Coxiellaceae bacterium]|nr:zinc ribbon domain-containing protein [Coxiellaceae bacterium]
MPIYEYQCEHCHTRLEKLQKPSDPRLTECPSCGKDSLKKLVSAAGFQLKGSGWYVTDFRDKGKKAPDKQEKSPEKADTAHSTSTNKEKSPSRGNTAE